MASLGVAQDCVSACMWFNLATAEGDEQAKEKGYCLRKYDQRADRVAQKLSREWLAKRTK